MKEIVIFASGAGSNALNIIRHFNANGKAEVCMIVCNNPTAGIVEKATLINIPVRMITRNDMTSPGQLISDILACRADLIVLAGFLWKIPGEMVSAFPNKIINIHPALLPRFGGKGMYGHHVHQAVKDTHERETGITVHFVNEHYDEGNTIFQARTIVEEDDSVEDIERKVRALEMEYFPSVVEQVLDKLD